MCSDRIPAVRQTNQFMGAQHGIELGQHDLHIGITENVMDLTSPSISIKSLT